jgi:hypothetical protein
MSKPPDVLRAEELTNALFESGTMGDLQRLQINAQIETLEAQKLAAAATERNSRYMPASVIIATIATLATTVGVAFNVLHSIH